LDFREIFKLTELAASAEFLRIFGEARQEIGTFPSLGAWSYSPFSSSFSNQILLKYYISNISTLEYFRKPIFY